MTENSGEIVFWTLRQKFFDNKDNLPEKTSQVMYYSLAIGHHVGVIDCLKAVLRCPKAIYCQWVALLDDQQARRKMLGVLTFDEITIDISHATMLSRAFAPLADLPEEPWHELSINFIELLDDIVSEPAIYLMARSI